MIWLVVGIVTLVVIIAVITLFAWACRESPLERAKREQLTAIRAHATRANYELDQASFAARRAIFEAIQQGLRDRDS